MLKSFIDIASHDRIAGWVLETEHPERSLAIRVVVDGHELASGTANHTRSDLKRVYGNGEHGFDFRLKAPLSTRRTHYISIRIDPGNAIIHDSVLMGTNEDCGLYDKIQPLLLSSTGLSGTTIMMKTLGNDKSIVVAGDYPYEFKLLTHYAHAIKILSAPAYDENWVDANQIHSDKVKIGANPFFNQRFAKVFSESEKLYEILGRFSTNRMAEAFSEITQKFYEEISREQKKINPLYFVEKCDILTNSRDYTRLQYKSCKEIVLVRDLRDVYCSSRAFWSVGESFINNIVDAKNIFMNIVQNPRRDTLIIRYEDFILDQDVCLERISDFLDLGRGLCIGESVESALFERHATSSSPESSIGRWKTDLSDEERGAFRGRLDDFFEAFDYEIDGP